MKNNRDYRTKKIKNNNKSLKLLNFVLFSFIFASIGFYLFNISQVAAQGFTMKELEANTKALASQKSELEERLSMSQSYYSLSSRIAELNMVEVTEPEYIKAAPAVAKK